LIAADSKRDQQTPMTTDSRVSGSETLEFEVLAARHDLLYRPLPT
jgi:hypothetical protein